MNIAVLIQENLIPEFKGKFNQEAHNYFYIDGSEESLPVFKQADLIFDFLSEGSFTYLHLYAKREGLPVFYHAVKTSVAEIYMKNPGIKATIIGFNGLPTFINRSVLEATILNDSHEEVLKAQSVKLNTEYTKVSDRVGMVTPRIICMIINEAYYTFQEGTASKADIDTGMKLGTNYPYGPFEWADKIGLSNIYEVLEAIYEDTKDQRYKICPLLKREHMTSVGV